MFSRVSEGSNSISKSSKVYGEGSSVSFGEEEVSDVDKSTGSTIERKEELPFFLAALGAF